MDVSGKKKANITAELLHHNEIYWKKLKNKTKTAKYNL